MSRQNFYLDKSNAKVSGVCAGLAEYTGVDAFWVRLSVVLLTLFGFGWFTIPAYVAMAWMADKKPMHLYNEEEEERLLRRMERRREKTGHSLERRHGRSARLRSDISDIDRRVAEMEAHYSTSNSRLAAEIDSLR